MANSWAQVSSEVQRLGADRPDLVIEVTGQTIVVTWAGKIDARWAGPTSGPRINQGPRHLDYRLTITMKSEAKASYDWSEDSASRGKASGSVFVGKQVIRSFGNTPDRPEEVVKQEVFAVLKANGWKPAGLIGRLFG